MAEYLRIQGLNGEEHDAEIRGVRDLHVLLADHLGEQFNRPGQRLFRRFYRILVAGFACIQQVLVVLQGELAVNGQPHRAVLVLPWHPNREFHPLRRPRPGRDVFLVLIGRQQLLKDVAQLILAQDAFGLDVEQHLLQVSHPAGQRLHLTEPLVHLLKPLTDLLERFAEPLLEGGLQLFIHRLPHLLEALAVVLPHLLELGLHRTADILHGLERLLVLLVQLLDQVGEALAQQLGLPLALFLGLLAEPLESRSELSTLGLRLFT